MERGPRTGPCETQRTRSGRRLALGSALTFALLVGACGGQAEGSSVQGSGPKPSAGTGGSTTPSPGLAGSASSTGGQAAGTGTGTGGTGGTPTTADTSACGGCTDLAMLRCDPATLKCVECLVAEDCAPGSQQQCMDGWCTNVDPSVTACPAKRVAEGASCGLSGYTCIYGTLGGYACHCGDGAAIGATTFQATVWSCSVL